jgi:hypothetical protein
VLLLAHGLIMRSEVSVPSVLLRQEMTAMGVRVIHEGIVHVLVVGPNALLEPHLLDPVSVLQASLSMVKILISYPLFTSARLYIVVLLLSSHHHFL